MMRSRRDFLRAIPAAWGGLAAALQAADPAREQYWELVRRQFPLEEGLVYLNAANVCPASRPVMDRYLHFLRDFHANPSFQNRDKYAELQERVRSKTAALLGVSADEIAITRNTSEGSNIVVKGVDLKPGDEILITAHNHPSNNDSWKVRARRDGLVVRALPTPVPAASRDAVISAFEKAVTDRTRLIAITHVTSTCGLLYPVREVGALANRRNIWYHLDGAQTFGALAFNLREIGCDSYSASMHKWPMGPLEAGVLYVRAERINGLWPSIVTAGWSDHLKGARKFEVFGQRDDPRIASMEASIDFLNLLGMSNVEARLRALSLHLKRELVKVPGVTMRTNLEPDLSGGVIRFTLRGVPHQQAYDALWKRARVAMAVTAGGESEGLRFSPHVYNTFDDLNRAVAAVRELAG